MSTLFALPLIVLMAGMMGRRWIGTRWRDDKSIRAHRSTLGVIEHVAGAEDSGPLPDRSGHVRIVAGSDSGRTPVPDEEILPSKPPQRRGSRPSFPQPKETSPPPAELESRPALAAPPRPPRPPGVRRPPRRSLAVAIPVPRVALLVSAVLALGAGIGIALSQGGHPTTASSHRPTTPGRVSEGGSRPNSSPATTLPAVVATSAGANNASYTVNAATLNLALVATRACWIELRSGSAAGPIVYEGTLPAGAAQTFRPAGPVWLRVGFPAGVRMTIDGFPVSLPATGGPFDLSVSGPAGA